MPATVRRAAIAPAQPTADRCLRKAPRTRYRVPSEPHSRWSGSCATGAWPVPALPCRHRRTMPPTLHPIRASPSPVVRPGSESYSLSSVSRREIQRPARTRDSEIGSARARLVEPSFLARTLHTRRSSKFNGGVEGLGAAIWTGQLVQIGVNSDIADALARMTVQRDNLCRERDEIRGELQRLTTRAIEPPGP